MTVWVAVAASGRRDAWRVPDGCVAALNLPGAMSPEHHTVERFSCAAARTRADGYGLHVAQGVVIAGDVRLDGRGDLLRALRDATGESPVASAPGAVSDLALIHAAYGAWGAAAVERLRGDFSFVVWDDARRQLIAARDGLGVRPLYYARIPDGLCLSNTLDAVRAYPGVDASIRDSAVVSFLQHGWNRDVTTTTFAAISRLPAAAMLCHADGDREPAVRIHWRMPEPAPLHYARDSEYAEHYRALLDAAVGDRMAASTALLLSGGLDSGSIAATMSRIAPGTTSFAVTTRMPEVESADESGFAALVADRAQMPHELHEAAIEPFSGRFARTPEPYDDPELPANADFFATIGRRAPVVLQGEDGDALFSPPGIATMVRRSGAIDTLRQMVTHTLTFGQHPYMGFWLARRLRFWKRGNAVPRPAWLRREAGVAPHEPSLVRNAARPEAASRLSASIWQSLHQGNDRAFLGAALEFRWPLLDTRLIDFVFAIPPVPWCQRKYLVRRAYAGELPAAVIARPKTTVPGYFEFAVSKWRRRTGGIATPLHERTAEFVDARRLADTLHRGDTEAVLAGWRALQLDRWFRYQEAA